MDEEKLLKFLIKNNFEVISTLDDLGKCCRVLLYCCIYLLLKDNGKKNTYKTFLFLENSNRCLFN